MDDSVKPAGMARTNFALSLCDFPRMMELNFNALVLFHVFAKM